MEWWHILILVLVVIPIICIPVAFIWYINIGGIYLAIKEAREKRAARQEKITAVAETEQHVTAATPRK